MARSILQGDPVQLVIEQTSTFWNSLVFLVSTPSIKGASRIESDRERDILEKYGIELDLDSYPVEYGDEKDDYPKVVKD